MTYLVDTWHLSISWHLHSLELLKLGHALLNQQRNDVFPWRCLIYLDVY